MLDLDGLKTNIFRRIPAFGNGESFFNTSNSYIILS
jgi:hypothetical protein